MKLATLLIFSFIFIWAVFNAVLLGYISIPPEYYPKQLHGIGLPSSTASLGDSAAIIDSLFSSFALALGLMAVLMQGRELKASTSAQTDQALALTEQIQHQQNSNRLGAYSARLQFLLTDADRLDSKISELVTEVESSPDNQEKSEKWTLIRNLRNKERRCRSDAEEIDQKIKELLHET